MRKEGFIRALLFIILFSFGAAGLGLAVLSSEIADYYRSKGQLALQKKLIEQLKQLNEDYNDVLVQLETDPNMIKRLAPVILGVRPNDPNTAYPQANAGQIALVKNIIKKHVPQKTEKAMIPTWLKRINQPKRRSALGLSGTFLILLSFMLFARKGDPEEESIES